MKHRRVRTDEFKTQEDFLRVTGRQGYEQSTDIWISRDMEVEFEQKSEETIDPGFHVVNRPNEEGFYDLKTFTRLNVNGTVDCKLARGSICKGLENVRIKPVGCTSHYDGYPKTQQKLLPYLVPSGTRSRMGFLHQSVATFDSTSEVGNSPTYQWDPLINNHFVVGTSVNNLVAGHVESVESTGFVPRDVPNPNFVLGGNLPENVYLIEFGTSSEEDDVQDQQGQSSFTPYDADRPWLLPVQYKPETDELVWNEPTEDPFSRCVVKIDEHVFDGAQPAGVNFHYFALKGIDDEFGGNDSWSAKFDRNGIAGRVAEHGLLIPEEEPLPEFDRPGPLEYDPANVPLDQHGQPNPDYIPEHILLQEHINKTAEWERYDTYRTKIREVQEAEKEFGLKNARSYPDNNATYRFSHTKLNEFWEIRLIEPHGARKFDELDGGNNNTALPGPVNIVGLYLRRPKFSKGQALNWEMNPALARFYNWFEKQIDPNGPVVHRKVALPLPTPFEQLLQKDTNPSFFGVGEFEVGWAGVGDVGQGNTHRYIEELTITMDDEEEELYDNLDNLVNQDEEISLFLTSGERFDDANDHHVVQRPFARPPVVQPGFSKDFILRFKRRHAQFPGNQVITLERSGANGVWDHINSNFPHGVPSIINLADLHPSAQGVQPVKLGWIQTPTPGLPLVYPTVRDPNGLYPDFPFDYNTTEVPNSWVEGSRPLFSTNAAFTDNFSYHAKLNAGDSDTDPVAAGDGLFTALDTMFTGTVHTLIPGFQRDRSVVQSRSKSTLRLNEPFFGLDSGMSTHGVTQIFKPKSWYPLLLQDIDYHFTRASNAPKQMGDLTTYKVTQGGSTTDVKATLKLTEGLETKLTVRSRDGLDQRIKLLESMNDSYPLFKKHSIQIEGSSAPTGTVSIYSEKGVPDYLFIYAERNLSKTATYVSDTNPVVVGIKLTGRANKHRALSSYLFSKHELWQATLRNAHYQSKAEDLYTIGGCLISKEDLGTLERHEFTQKDCFDYDIAVSLENEEGGSEDQKTDRDADSISLHVCCIYEDSLILQGTAQHLSFSEEQRLYK